MTVVVEVLAFDEAIMMQEDLRRLCEMLHEIGTYVPASAEDLGRRRTEMWALVKDIVGRAPYENKDLFLILLTFFYDLATGGYATWDLDAVRTCTPEELYQALLRVSLYREPARALRLLLVNRRDVRDTLYSHLANRHSNFDSLAVVAAAGSILMGLEEHDPHLQVAGPGLMSYLERWVFCGAPINCAAMIETILSTIERVRR
jgi:hypothetical protein